MAINPPVDATQTPEWPRCRSTTTSCRARASASSSGSPTIRARREAELRRRRPAFRPVQEPHQPETLKLFADLAKAVKLDERTKAMYTGVHINNTEDRAVLHTALRRPVEDEGKYIVDGQDTVKDVREVLGRIYAFADKVRSGEWTGVTGKRSRPSSTSASAAPTWVRSWCTRRSSRTPTPASRPATSPTSTRTTWPRRPRASIRRPRCSSSSRRPSPRWRP